MANAYTTSPSTISTIQINGQTEFTIPFEFLARRFVAVTLLGSSRVKLTLGTDYRYIASNKIQLLKPVGDATHIELRRVTSATDRLVNFSDGSILRAYDMNLSAIQTLHVAEEARDLAGLGIVENDDGDLDARLRKIVNLKDGTNDFDAVNLRQLRQFDQATAANADRAEKAAEETENAKAVAEEVQRRVIEAEAKAVASAGTAMQAAMDAAYSADIVSSTAGQSTRLSVEMAKIDSMVDFGGLKVNQVTKRLRGLISVDEYGADNTGVNDSTAAVQAAFDAAPAGSIVTFPTGTYKFGVVFIDKPCTLIGNATLNYLSFRIRTSDFTSLYSGQLNAREYINTARAFQVIAYEDGKDYENIKIINNRFSGFFYNTDFRGRAYAAEDNDTSNKVLRDTLVMGCTSRQPADGRNRGHFQHTGVTNAKVIGCSSYGGRNATSYNFINGNGYIAVIGCYDEDNSYGSLEIENNKVSWGVVSGNTFKKDLWIDDTSNILIGNNVVSAKILLTTQNEEMRNVNVVGNLCNSISITKFGDEPSGGWLTKHGIAIRSNLLTCVGVTHGIFSDAYTKSATIEGNTFSRDGTHTNDIALVRSDGCDFIVRMNDGSKVFLTSGSGGSLVEYGNGFSSLPSSDSQPLSKLLVPNKDYLDLPGKYLHGTKYTGNVNAGASGTIVLPVPSGGTFAQRGVSLWVMVRNLSTGNNSSFRVDCIWSVSGNFVGLSTGQKYSTIGVNAADIAVANDGSTNSEIRVALTNNHADQVMQITVMPEVSSRFGTQE